MTPAASTSQTLLSPRPSLSTVAELLKPITWFPPMWAFACGIVSSGQPAGGRWFQIAAGIALSGPLVCASSQAANDWFDRHVDAINEPTRPIPSGRMPGRWGLGIAILWTLISLAVATLLGRWGLVAAILGLALAWAYSAPPFRLKQNGWWGNAACGLSYEGLAWITGAVVMLRGNLPDARILGLALLYSVGAHGIMTLNDFKAMAGDRALGIRSLPVQLGPQRAAAVACSLMLLPQLGAVACLLRWGASWHPYALIGLIVIQALLMIRFLRQPVVRAIWYSAVGVNFFVAGMMISALAVRRLLSPL